MEAHNPDAALDVEGRLANEQRATLGAVANPTDVRAAGDSQSRHAVLEVLAAAPAALAFLLGSVAQARPQSAKRLLLAGGLMLSVSLAMAVALEALLW